MAGAGSRTEAVLGEPALQGVRSDQHRAVVHAVTTAAVYTATAGFLNEANRLLQALWPQIDATSGDSWLDNRAMEALWYAAGARPAGVPFAQEPLDRLELAHRAYVALDQWGDWQPETTIEHLSGNALLRGALHLAYPVEERLPPPESERAALAGLHRYIATELDSEHGSTIGKVLTLAAELAARHGDREQAINYVRMWAAAYPRWWPNMLFPAMAANRHVAPLLLEGILAGSFDLTAPTCAAYVEELLATMARRFREGPSLAFGDRSLLELLQEISRLADAEDEVEYELGRERPPWLTDWLGRSPATERMVVALEHRLGLSLPAEYRQFLLTSDGFAPSSTVDTGLLPCELVGWLRDGLDSHTFGLMVEMAEWEDELDAAALERAVLIGGHQDSSQWLMLIPPAAAGGEWQTWWFAFWGGIGFHRKAGIRSHLEEQLRLLQE